MTYNNPWWYREWAERLCESMRRNDHMAVMRACAALSERLPDVASEAAIGAVREGHTVKSVAEALDVPVSTLRGIRQEAGVA